MKNIAWLSIAVVITFLTFNTFIEICEARGGRGRGGGSFGGIFGGWRKYKKPTSNSNSRRTISGSPMHTTATKSVPSGSFSSSNSMKQPSQQASYPKQQMPLGASSNTYGYGYNRNAAGGAPLPPGSTYYPNMGAMPPGAIYYAQPMRSSSGTGDFLFGMLAGHMASNMLFGPRHHVTHVYHQNPDGSQQSNPPVYVINNGEVTKLNTTPPLNQSSFWPTETDTPLAPLNDTVTPVDGLQPAQPPVSNVQFSPSSTLSPSLPSPSLSPSLTTPTTPQEPPANGIICMPVQLNETDPNDPSKVHQVERTICFPAPPPQPTPTSSENTNCVIRTIIETDPNDPSQTIEVPKEICTTPTSTSEPRQVAGEIGENKQTTSVENEKENANNEQSPDNNSEGETK